MRSRMEMIFVGTGHRNSYKAGVGAIFDTDAQTWAAFKSYRRIEVPQKKATFLLDYYNRRGDLAHTIFLDNAGFTAISGEAVKTSAEYRKVDRKYWDKARERFAAGKTSMQPQT
jgi:hypothetical protein